jgi:hypothetical protein
MLGDFFTNLDKFQQRATSAMLVPYMCDTLETCTEGWTSGGLRGRGWALVDQC